MNIREQFDISLTTKYSALFKVGAVFIPSVTLIGLVTAEIFKAIGLSDYTAGQSLGYFFTVMSAIRLTSIIATLFRLTVPMSTEVMQWGKIYKTALLFLPAVCCLATAKQLTTGESYIRQLRFGSVFLPSALLINATIKPFFEFVGWQASKWHLTTRYMTTIMIAITLTAMIGKKCQWAATFPTSFKLSAAISYYSLGIFGTKLVLENIALGTNYQTPRSADYSLFMPYYSIVA